jgi:NitT/TauT family transport system substrate-binding protein
MGYVPNVQYAPFYVADAKGYFEQAGLEVSFDYSSEVDGVALVGSGELTFALASGEQVLLAREQGAPVVYVFAWWQDFPVAVASLADAGIRVPQDLVGAKIGLPGRYGASYIGYQALMRSAGLDPESATLDSIGFNQVEALTAGADDAVVVYANNEPIQLRSEGYELNVIRVSDYVQLASNGLITSERTITERPDLVRSMVGAVLHGLRDTIADPEAAYQISADYVEGLSAADRQVQMGVLETSIGFWHSDQLGVSKPEAWQNMQNVLLDMDLLSQPMDVTDAYSNAFVGTP